MTSKLQSLKARKKQGRCYDLDVWWCFRRLLLSKCYSYINACSRLYVKSQQKDTENWIHREKSQPHWSQWKDCHCLKLNPSFTPGIWPVWWEAPVPNIEWVWSSTDSLAKAGSTLFTKMATLWLCDALQVFFSFSFFCVVFSLI